MSEETVSTSRSAMVLPLILVALLVGVLAVRFVNERLLAPTDVASPPDDPAGLVTLTRQSPGAEPVAADVPWRPGDTVLDATRAAGLYAPDLWASQWRGEGEMAFLTELGGVPNEGADGRNWLFSVNGELADRGAGAVELQANDRVLWSLDEYE